MICIYRDSRKDTDTAALGTGGKQCRSVADRAGCAAVSPSLQEADPRSVQGAKRD